MPGGRPKTGAGYRDDAVLSMIDFQGRVEQLLKQRQQHYRIERDVITEILEDLRTAMLAWRYGEIQDGLTATASTVADRLRGVGVTA